MSEETSLRELVRNFINEKFQENKLDTKSKRSQALKDFLSKHEDKKFKKRTVEATFHDEFNKLLEKKQISKSSVGKTTKAPKIRQTKQLEGEISHETQAAPEGSATGAKAPKLEGEKTEGDSVYFEPEDVSAAINAFWLILKVNYPTLDLLSDSEKASLGRLWLPAFRKYLTENWKVIGIPLLATLGMIVPKIKSARDDKKKKKDKQSRDSAETTAKDRTCPFCNQIFPKDKIAEHKDICKKKLTGT